MLSEKIKILFNILGAENKEIAEASGLDPSGISRIRSGKRLPKSSSKTIRKLASGIYNYADDYHKTSVLAKVLGCSVDLSEKEMKIKIISWLFDGSKITSDDRATASKSKETLTSFGAKLDASMTLTNLSNAKFGNLLHIDKSVVSRFRNGLRIPKGNPRLIDEICSLIYSRALELDKQAELFTLAGIPKSFWKDKDECMERFRIWLSDFGTEDGSIIAESLIDNIAGFPDNTTYFTSSRQPVEDTVYEVKSVYYGTDGLRQAVIRFLSEAVKNNASELLLYSDQNMGWMLNDKAFFSKWKSLMGACIENNIKIRIIHNVTRNASEMYKAINSWLPLYMSGMVASYYCRTYQERPFSHTAFLCPGVACVSGFNLQNSEEPSIYRYDTDPAILRVQKDGFEKFISESRQLVWIYSGIEAGKKIFSLGESVSALNFTLSLPTMPEHVLNSILERSMLDEEAKAEIFAQWEDLKNWCAKSMASDFVHEYIKVASEEEILAGKVPVDLTETSVTYTPDEYRDHIKNIIDIAEKHENYRFFALPDEPFSNVRIAVLEKYVSVTKMNEPAITFVFYHPAIRDAFVKYFKKLKERYRKDRTALRRHLKRYL
ncbi:MAG: helix-turn-helix transcriptional regulator [Firmicutes bacterium]|nr:helix-turn-helix transcriptional regulator [Bacillota bacterium]